MFNQAESVSINGKEVASIITADGGVLYQRNPGYDLALSCDKPILSFKDNDSCTITGVLTKDNIFIEAEEIGYQIVHNYAVLDEGILITDEFGEISLDYVSEGVGDVDVVFSLRNLLQKTYVITDLYFYYPDPITPDIDSPLNLGTLNSNFIIELDYYPVDIWEWAWIRWDDSNHGVWSSSYDKGNNIGITNLGYNKWVHLTYKYENGTVTMTADTQKDISYVIDKELPFAVDLYSNRYGTIYQNLKLKLL